MSIKHFSFDLWLTLIKSNPLFKEERAKYFYDKYNSQGLELEKIKQIIHSIDKNCDVFNEKTGQNVSATARYAKVLNRLGVNSKEVMDDSLRNIKLDINRLFLDYKPFLLNKDIITTLDNLKNDFFRLNLASNTGFIEGNVIIDILKELKLYQYFDFLIFSDQIKTSKPSNLFYDYVFKELKNKFEKKQVIHLGDNYNADFLGAMNYGFQAIHITNSDYTYDTIKEGYEKIAETERS